MTLSPEQYQRYHRQCILPQVGIEGQERLCAARVLIVGVGGLGCPQALYMAAAGVGNLGIVDFDVVDLSNLHRQVLFGPADVGRPKVEVARERLKHLNPECTIQIYPCRLTSENARDILNDYEYVLDGTDNFATRYLINDAAVLLGKTNIYGSIFQFEAQISVFGSPGGPCYRCLFPEPPAPGEVPSCAEAGVIGVLPGMVALVQATEAVKLICRMGTPLVGRLLLVDALRMRWRSLAVRKDPSCPVCGEAPAIRELIDYDAFCGSADPEEGIRSISALDLAEILKSRPQEVVVVDIREPAERERCRIEGSLFVPLGQIKNAVGELEKYRGKTLVFYCKRGVRSARAIRILKEEGFSGTVLNLEGGLFSWSAFVEPELQRYL